MPFEDRLLETDYHIKGGDMFFYKYPGGDDQIDLLLESAIYGNHVTYFKGTSVSS